MLDEASSAFVERVGQHLYAQGMPRMAGRIWGYLLICEPPEQTAAELATALHASRGSISGMVRLLEAASLIERSTRPGDRRERFSVPRGFATSILRGRAATITAWRELVAEGLALLADRPPVLRARLQDLHDVYAFMERELPALLERYLSERTTQREGAA
jgi:DNA-binding transcriptional regulator GbsR (MarR family)